MPDQPQTIKDCAALRQECRDDIFGKMDEQHGEVMAGIIDLRVLIAKREGRDTAEHDRVGRRSMSWLDVTKAIAIITAAIAAGVAAVWKGIT